MRQNTEKLQFLSQKLELGSRMESVDKSGALQAKEIMLKDQENRLKLEKQELDGEKKKLTQKIKELNEKESR